MRKRQKSEIVGLLGTLENAHNILQKMKKKRETAGIEEVLVLCQESAIHIGTSIEETEGEGTKAVQLLEEYCELVYKISLPESDSYICKQLNHIISDVRTEVEKFPIKLEVVFLPYKYSMWDSMESVWMAANADSDCDAYVMPIPYFGKDTNGQFASYHYEGELFVGKVPIISFQEYNIAERNPDMVFIHNPYDNSNFVTSVHPDYYASKLYKETEKLIYLPYDICVNDKVGKNYAVTCASIYANYVILQSEKVREQYINYFREMAVESGNPQLAVNVENRFVALGSPKLDKVKKTCCQNVEIPESWKKLIGSGEERKKVVLYNTHLSNLMGPKGRRFIKKLNAVFEQFQKREDVVLLWRPHPLSITTAEAMNPQILPEYLAMIDRFRKEEIGIYDDTADMERAIAISDAYYGDGGSLLELYRATDKPMMIQNISLE